MRPDPKAICAAAEGTGSSVFPAACRGDPFEIRILLNEREQINVDCIYHFKPPPNPHPPHPFRGVGVSEGSIGPRPSVSHEGEMGE